MASFHSRDMSITLEGGFGPDGRLLSIEADVIANVGAYAPYPNTAAVEPLMSLAELPGPYDSRRMPAGRVGSLPTRAAARRIAAWPGRR